MSILATLASVLALFGAHHHKKVHHAPRYPHYVLNSTAYCEGGTTASGRPVFFGEVANNMWPLGTLLKFDHPVLGKTYFRVLDRIGYGSQLDIWMPSCSTADWWGRRNIGVEVVHYGW